MKYIITWLIVYTYSTPCPTPPDEFGRFRITTTLVACSVTDETKHRREFTGRNEATNFYSKLDSISKINIQWTWDYNGWVKDLKIDSIKIITQ